MKIMIMKCDFQYKFYFPDTLMFINKLLRNKDPTLLAGERADGKALWLESF